MGSPGGRKRTWPERSVRRGPPPTSGDGSGECIGWPTGRLKHKGHFPEEKFPVRPQSGLSRPKGPRRRRRGHLRDAEWNDCGNKALSSSAKTYFSLAKTYFISAETYSSLTKTYFSLAKTYFISAETYSSLTKTYFSLAKPDAPRRRAHLPRHPAHAPRPLRHTGSRNAHALSLHAHALSLHAHVRSRRFAMPVRPAGMPPGSGAMPSVRSGATSGRSPAPPSRSFQPLPESHAHGLKPEAGKLRCNATLPGRGGATSRRTPANRPLLAKKRDLHATNPRTVGCFRPKPPRSAVPPPSPPEASATPGNLQCSGARSQRKVRIRRNASCVPRRSPVVSAGVACAPRFRR